MTVNRTIDRLFLVGPMGSGKTTVARALARRLGRTARDLDALVEQRAGASIPEIFERRGEAGFRALEKHAFAEAAGQQGIVLATGGGTILDADTRALMERTGVVIYLRTGVAEQWRRVRGDTTRPLLRTPDPRARLAALFEKRDPLYRAVADITVDDDDAGVADAVEIILARLSGEKPAERQGPKHYRAG